LTIDFDSLTFANVTLDFERRRALNGVSVTFNAGEIVAVLGPNGAGKTTLLFVAATLLRPSSGEVRFGTWTPGSGGTALRGRIGLVGHDLYVYSELSAAENLRFFARLYHVGGVDGRVRAALSRAGLDGRADESIAAFSRGMRQRLAIERALIHEPRLVLLDEPFTGLDEASTVTLTSRLRSLRSQGCIVIVTTHDIETMDGLGDRAVLLQHGRMTPIEQGTGSLRERYRAQCLAGGLRTAASDR
jgi:heme ABC exporter ATP-binding subunit CcmA